MTGSLLCSEKVPITLHYLLHLAELGAVRHIQQIFWVAQMVFCLDVVLVFIQPIDEAR